MILFKFKTLTYLCKKIKTIYFNELKKTFNHDKHVRSKQILVRLVVYFSLNFK